MKLQITATNVDGKVNAPPSKSYTHRALVLSALAHGDSIVRKALLSADTLATLKGMESLGAIINTEGDLCRVRGGKLKAPSKEIDCANSGTTIRLLAGIASLLPDTVTLTGDLSLQQRPMRPLLSALSEMGVHATSARGDGNPPLIIRGPNTGRWAHIKGDVSSQFISSLIISSALKERDTDIVITTPLKSRPYIDMTLDTMASFGGRATATKDGYHISGGQRFRPCDYTVPGDYSSAAFPLVAGALTGSVSVDGLNPNDRQGDKAIIDILRGFGAKVEWRGASLVSSVGDLKSIDLDMSDCPDLFPIIAVLATQSKGTSRLFNAEQLRYKESDRIKTVASFLKGMGADISESTDGCVIKGPCKLRGKNVDSFGDHRILMSAAVAGLVADGITTVNDGNCFDISYPDFMNDMTRIGAKVEMVR